MPVCQDPLRRLSWKCPILARDAQMDVCLHDPTNCCGFGACNRALLVCSAWVLCRDSVEPPTDGRSAEPHPGQFHYIC